MIDNDNDNGHVLAIIESAERDTPHCANCGEHTVTVAHDDGSLWLECASQGQPALRRLLTLYFGAFHTRRRLVDADQLAA